LTSCDPDLNLPARGDMGEQRLGVDLQIAGSPPLLLRRPLPVDTGAEPTDTVARAGVRVPAPGYGRRSVSPGSSSGVCPVLPSCGLSVSPSSSRLRSPTRSPGGASDGLAAWAADPLPVSLGKLVQLIIQTYHRKWHLTPPWFQASIFLLDTTWCPFLLPPFQNCKHRVYKNATSGNSSLRSL